MPLLFFFSFFKAASKVLLPLQQLLSRFRDKTSDILWGDRCTVTTTAGLGAKLGSDTKLC